MRPKVRSRLMIPVQPQRRMRAMNATARMSDAGMDHQGVGGRGRNLWRERGRIMARVEGRCGRGDIAF